MKKTTTKSRVKQPEAEVINDTLKEDEPASEQLDAFPEQVPIDSLKAVDLGIEYGSLLRELHRSTVQMAVYHRKTHGTSIKEAIAFSLNPNPEETNEEIIEQIKASSLENLSWWEISILFDRDPEEAALIWRCIIRESRKEFLSGHRMANNLEVVDWQREPWKRAQFLAIRNGFVEGGKPRDAIELAMIDTMAQAHSEYLFWSEEVHRRSTTDMKMTYSNAEEEYHKGAKGNWVPPRVSEQEAIEHAMQMMDRFNRLFLRTLRQLRDLRRYSTPVTINNPQQVNIAADGGQQINAVKTE